MQTEQTAACQIVDAGAFERTRFFARQLVTPDDLTQDQVYFREKQRRHNRMLHGWGVVCGAAVQPGSEKCTVKVQPGYILGPYGDEIAIDETVTVDLCRETLDGNAAGPCGPAVDPWCSDVRVNRKAGQTFYLAVAYAECQSRPVRVAAGACGCDSAECQYSRTRDSYCIKVLSQLPKSYAGLLPAPDISQAFRCPQNAAGWPPGLVECPPCPSEPWVILADVVIGTDGTVSVDCFAHRRYVVSLAQYYYVCRQE